MVLVLAGLFLLMSHFFVTHTSHSVGPNQTRGESDDSPLVWFGPTEILPEGLYWLDNKAAHQSSGNSSDPLPSKGSSRLSEIPAHVAPILFLPIPINKASQDTLMVIPGIGSAIAEAIIRYRNREGRIEDKSALMKIEGIGVKKADSIADYVVFDK